MAADRMAMPISGYLACRACPIFRLHSALYWLSTFAPKCMQLRSSVVKKRNAIMGPQVEATGRGKSVQCENRSDLVFYGAAISKGFF